ncbi:MAG: energy-coupled thiamine transporter ThiT [Firmicutes bacterium]|nr:energy-coupled thiamine transporter ThiT [Bacillota bacterium]
MDIYVEISYIRYSTSVYDIETSTVEVKEVYHDHSKYLYVTTDNKVYLEMIGTTYIGYSFQDITNSIPFNEGLTIREVEFEYNNIFFVITEDRLFAISYNIFINNYLKVFRKSLLPHGFAGIVFLKDYAPEGMNYWFYSFIADNLPYMDASFGFCLIIVLF